MKSADAVRRTGGEGPGGPRQPGSGVLNDHPLPEQGTSVVLVPLDRLDDSPFQERKTMAETTLRELVESIREHGLLQPISVCRMSERFEIIAGHRRATAFRRLHDEAKTEEARQRFSAIPA